MSHHIHIYLRSAATRDGEYKRDADGKFASSYGSASQHRLVASTLMKQARSLPHNHPAREHLLAAHGHHKSAASALEQAHQMHAEGKHDAVKEHMALAESHVKASHAARQKAKAHPGNVVGVV